MSIQFYLDSERLAKVINVNCQTYYAALCLHQYNCTCRKKIYNILDKFAHKLCTNVKTPKSNLLEVLSSW